MAGFKSGLTYEQLRHIADNGGEESLSQGGLRKNGPRLQAVLTYRCDGKRKYVYHTLEGSVSSGRDATGKRAAKALLKEWRDDVVSDLKSISGITVDPTSSVRECVEDWIQNRVDLGKAQPSTATYYRNAAKRIFRYPLASMPINQLTMQIVQAWINDLSKTLAAKTVKASYDVLDATCRKVLGPSLNPCVKETPDRDGIELPSPKKDRKKGGKKPNALSLDGVARFNTLLDEREAAYDGIDIMAIGARLALHTGMRAEECCGLKWEDVDLAASEIHVVRAIQRAEIPVKDDDGEFIRDKSGNLVTKYTEFAADPKTEDSGRYIPLDPETVDMLSRHRETMTKMVKDAYAKKKRIPSISSLYVLGGVDGSFFSPYKLGKRWCNFSRSRNLLGTSGRPVTLHDLRHTNATRTLADGTDITTVSQLLGHSESSVTLNRYTTSDEQTKRAAVNRMARVFSMRELPEMEGVTPFRAGSAG